jgi:type IV pilus assembly protein PilY1
MRPTHRFRWSGQRFAFALAGTLGAALAAVLWTGDAEAQLGAANVPLPNVLLLQDTSGSFELMIDGNTPETAGEGGTCSPGTQSNPNRWGVAVQALTGNILPSFSCAAMDRSQSGFINQYELSTGVGGSFPPYDYNYYLPFHRPISYNASTSVACAYTPNALPGAPGGGVGFPPSATSPSDCSGAPCTALDFPPDAIGTYAFQSLGAPLPATGACAPASCANAGSMTVNNAGNACTFTQAPNGALDSASTLMRFGLMTFDNDTQPGTGVTNSVLSPSALNTTHSAFDGQWSYFNGWNLGLGGDTGYPAGCTIAPPPFFEVGARNPAAPPWEGRLITFPNQAADTTATVENNNLVQLAIQSMRPYGATPTAGMFADAEYYFWGDPAGPQATDNFVKGGCRPQYIILLTDGQPNEDLGVTAPVVGSTCAGTGKCPYQAPWVTAADLFLGNDPITGLGGASVTTYVIGFAVSQNITPAIANCSQLATVPGDFATYCSTATPSSPQYPCCILQQIAIAGQGGAPNAQAYFADTPGDLEAALGVVLGQITKQLSSRTLPVYSSTVSTTIGSAASTSMYLANFNGATSPWEGDIQRQEIVCQGIPLAPVRQLVTPSNGDDFGINLEPATTAPSSRKFLTYQLPPTGAGAIATIRPFDTAPTDGLVAFGQSGQEIGLTAGNVLGMTNLQTMLGATNTTCENPVTHAFTIPAAGCAQVGLSFLMAQPTVATGDTSVPSFDLSYATAAAPRVGYPLGAVLHSTPTISNPPISTIRDDSYQAFSANIASLPGANPRDPMLYVATTDGLLHAFDTTVAHQLANEAWSFIPPATFPNLISNYPAASNIVLDGAPVVRDVVWERDANGTTPQWTTAWHTMLVAGFGAGGMGYYALDVTDPRTTSYTATSNYASLPPSCAANTSNCTGPHFQWQIGSMNVPGGPTGQSELFGTTGTTPAITTVFADPIGAGANPSEIGVAILPGGSNGAPYAGLPCTRDLIQNPGSYTPLATYQINDPAFPIRSQVRAWAPACNGPGSGVPGRSVTIVRLDTGDILAVFARPASSSPDYPTGLNVNKLIPAPFDSPMTGTPIVYPNDVGTIAQQVFLGDADGTMWHLDITDPNPANWRAALFADSYSQPADQFNMTGANHLAYDSEAIAIKPLITIDRQANITLQYATGDQDSYTANYTVPGSPNQIYPAVNFIYSVKLTNPAGGASVASTNWYLPLQNGARATGPLAVFDGTLYFATFAPPNPAVSSAVCAGGNPTLWGLDYEVPNGSCGGAALSCGGMPNTAFSNPSGSIVDPLDDNNNSTVNIVIPGVAVAVTPSCTTTTAPAVDQYTGGMQVGMTGNTAGTYSLMAQIAGKNTSTNAQQTITKQLMTPNSTTVVDSWAGLTE